MPQTPAWPELSNWFTDAANSVQVLSAQRDNGLRALQIMELDETTALGAMVLHSGGLLVDGGWLRVLGSGHPRLPGSVLDWNGLSGNSRPAIVGGALIVAHDLIGGIYAVNAGGLPGEDGQVSYFSPASRRWEELGTGYTGLLRWVCEGDLAGAYNALRWPDWEDEAVHVGGDQGVHLWPPPWTMEGRDPSTVDRRVVAMDELVELVFTGRPPKPLAAN
jgi:hypothetical protein